jgi:hypothetical protein
MNSHLCINEKYVFAYIISFWYTRLNSYTDFWQIYIDSVIGIVCRFYVNPDSKYLHVRFVCLNYI